MASKMDIEFFETTPERESSGTVQFSVVLNAEELSAVKGWKYANDADSTPQALRELVRLGLLSEISGAYGLIKSIRQSVD